MKLDLIAERKQYRPQKKPPKTNKADAHAPALPNLFTLLITYDFKDFSVPILSDQLHQNKCFIQKNCIFIYSGGTIATYITFLVYQLYHV